MRIRVQNELLALNITTVLLVIVLAFFPSSTLCIVLGVPLALFFLGYTLIAAVFPRRTDLNSIERVALSFGFSIAMVPFIILILDYTPWVTGPYLVLIAITTFILATSLIAWHRRRRLAEMERFTVSLTFSVTVWKGRSFIDKILSVILIASILGAMGALVYGIAALEVKESDTGFYMLGLGGKAENYVEEVVVGEEGRVRLGIINREHETVSYRVRVRIDGVINNEVGPLVLGHGEKWEKMVSFTPHRVGDDQKVEFLLHKEGQSEAYRSLRLWVNVKRKR